MIKRFYQQQLVVGHGRLVLALLFSLFLQSLPGLNVRLCAQWKLYDEERPILVSKLVTRDDRLFAATDKGVYMSIDEGENWTSICSGNFRTKVKALVSFNTSIYAAFEGLGLWATDNYGKNWYQVVTATKSNNIDAMSVQGSYFFVAYDQQRFNYEYYDSLVWHAQPRLPFNLVRMTSSQFLVFAVDEFGSLWQSKNAGYSFSRRDKGLIGEIFCDPVITDTSCLVAGMNGIFSCKLFDSVWTKVSSLPFNEIPQAMAWQRGKLYVATTRRLVYKEDGGNWTESKVYAPDNAFLSMLVTPRALYATALLNGVYRSADSCKSWQPVNNVPLLSAQCNALCSQGSTLYAALNGTGVIKSQNAGQQWQHSSMPFQSQVIRRIHSFNNTLYCCSRDGVSISSDGGTSWQYSNQGLPGKDARDMCLMEDVLCVASAGKVYVSLDKGASWTLRFQEQSGDSISYLASEGKSLYAASKTHLYFSHDYGMTWDTRMDLSIFDITSICCAGQRVLVATQSNGLFTSSDGGIYFLHHPTFLNGACYGLYASAGIVYMAYNSASVYCSFDDGVGWYAITDDLSLLTIRCFTVYNSTLFAGAADGRILTRPVPEALHYLASWHQILGSDRQNITSISADEDRLYAGTLARGAFVSKSEHDWNDANAGLKEKQIQAMCVSYPYVILGTYGKGLWRSRGDTLNWVECASGAQSSHVSAIANRGGFVAASTFDRGVLCSLDSGAHWYSASHGLIDSSLSAVCITAKNLVVSSPSGTFLSADSGKYWTQAKTLSSTSIACMSSNGMMTLAGSRDGGVWLSLDGANTWQAAGLTDLSVNAVLVQKNVLVVGSNTGLFYSTDSAKTWSPAQTGFATGRISSLAATERTLFAGTADNGVYRRDFRAFIPSYVILDAPSDDAPNRLSLFPNPAQNTLSIRCSENLGATVEVDLSSVVGQTVLRHHEVRSEAAQDIRIDLSLVPEGSYVLRLSDGLRQYWGLVRVLR